MKTLLLIVVLAVLCGMPLYFLYWRLFRPVVLARLRYRIFAARDDLRVMALNGEISANEKAFPILEHRCGAAIRVLEHVDIAEVVLCKPSLEIKLKVQHEHELINASGPGTRKVDEEIRSVVVGAVLLNSPGMFFFGFPLLGLVVLLHWFARVKNFLLTAENRTWGVLYVEAASQATGAVGIGQGRPEAVHASV
jgi:hypothetical protein